MNPHDEVVEIQGQEPTIEDEAWLTHAVKLREQAQLAYNEAAKALITAASLFLAFYGALGGKVMEKASISVVLMLVPPAVVILSVIFSVAVLVPFKALILVSNITEIKAFNERAINRKKLRLFLSIAALAIGTFSSLLLLFLSSGFVPGPGTASP